MSLFAKSTIIEIIIILFSMLFLYTGISKLVDYNLFKEQIAVSPLLVSFARYIALGVPWIEFAVVVLLLVPRWRFMGFIAAVVLMVIFTGYVGGIILLNDKLPCSCGGIMQELSWQQHLVVNSVFIVLGVV